MGALDNASRSHDAKAACRQLQQVDVLTDMRYFLLKLAVMLVAVDLALWRLQGKGCSEVCRAAGA